jgi:hypothetical protein
MSTGSTTDKGAAGPPSGPGPKKGKLFGIDNRFLAPILITCILVVGDWKYRILESYWATGLAILSAIFLELLLGRFATGRWVHLASAYISGISVGILIRSTYLWPYIVCSLLSISSKYALRVKGRHLWNPSNLGVSVMLLLVPQAVAVLSQQWGNEPWPLFVIWCLGCMILYRFGLLHITLTYVASFIALSFVRSAATGQDWITEVAPLTGPMYQLFIFFMITDPKTITRTKARQCCVAFLVAVAEAILRLNRVVNAPFYALFIVGPTTNLIEIWWTARHAVPRGSSVQPAPALTAGAPSVPETPAVASPSAP